jgi:hypothetical protein
LDLSKGLVPAQSGFDKLSLSGARFATRPLLLPFTAQAELVEAGLATPPLEGSQ